ncbi:MAG: hypothetical protein HXX12_13785 [Geothrix sp.]|uniref:PEP/pyruvate-binding domain-containing protein n=1 Tax=Geothrix sp. TaxID=1962974 RepID=UPI00181FF826|nr:PEP/pyruvate-binding domain-containing protein [Geothrix sp.]NWJ42029.1 hypothetical protein [Geothrix sp.]WIL20003.1 MAG: PEP-utilizing enzyme [Geothrix sp.]
MDWRLLDPRDELRVEACGGKALGLARLGAAGLPVPDWFCLSADTFRRALGPALGDFHAGLAAASPEDRSGLEALCARGRAAVDALVLPPDALRGAALEHLPGADLFAVRSSACVEDSPEASFAGQLQSFLCVPAEGLEQAVLACWRSYFSAGAARYRLHHGLGAAAPGMAVILQRMVEAQVSGIAFSVSPDGNLGELLLSATYGLGPGVVSGEFETDLIRIDRRSGAIRSTQAVKAERLVKDAAAGRGLRREPVPEALRRAPCLGPEQVAELAGLCLRAERALGDWVDLEWAFDTRFHLLQARPITALPAGEIHLLDNSNIVESYPGISAPLTFAFVQQAYARIFRNFALRLGLRAAELDRSAAHLDQMVVHFQGRIYYSLENWYALFSLLPFASRFIPIWEGMLGIRAAEGAPGGPGLATRLLAGPRALRIGLRLLGEFLRLRRSMAALLARFEALKSNFDARLQTASRGGLDALRSLYDDLGARMVDGWELTLINDGFAFLFTALAQWSLRRLLPPEAALEAFNGLLCGLAGMASLQPAREAIRLGERLQDHPGLLAAALAAAEARLDRLPADAATSPEEASAIADFNTALADYLQRCGSRTFEELKLERPSHAEAPWLLLRQVAACASQGLRAADMEAREAAIRARAEGLLASAGPRPVTRVVFSFCLARAKASILHREASRLKRGEFYRMVRRIFLAAGERLAQEGLLHQVDDIFYLTVDEAFGAATLGATALEAKVATRRAEQSAQAALSPPERIVWKGSLAEAERVLATTLGEPGSGAGDAAGFTLSGLGCAPGQVSGGALVVADPGTVTDARGKVLVARMTDPGWVFLMLQARGLIVEKGSLLSHTAIIGRELGLPTLVGVTDAARRIRSGDQLSLDSGRGTVTVRRG